MATNLTLYSSRSHFFLDRYVFQDERSQPPVANEVNVGGYPVGRAVAASSAFPFLFPPLRLAHDDPFVNVAVASLGAKAHHLTDGGVFENLGISVLRDLIRTQQGKQEFDPANEKPILVVSDAGGRLDWELDERQSRGFIRRLLRSSEISQFWSEQRLEVGKGPNERVVKIDDPITTAVVANAPSQAVQNAVAKLRTDFDAFSALEWNGLFSQGYAAAKKTLGDLAPSRPVAVDPYNPWQSDGADWQNQTTAKKLQRGQRRRWRLFALHSFDGFWLANVGIIVAIMAGGYLASKPAIRISATGWAAARNWARGTMPAKQLLLAQPPTLAGPGFQVNSISTMTADASLQLSLANLQFSATAASLGDANAALIVWQEKPFEADLGTVRRKIKFRSNTQLEDAVAYLVDISAPADATGIRPIHMPRSGPENVYRPTGEIVIDAPNKGELLVMVLRVTAQKPDDPDKFPRLNVNLYNITLEVE